MTDELIHQTRERSYIIKKDDDVAASFRVILDDFDWFV